MMTRINLAGNWLFFPDEEKHYSAPPEQFTDEITLPGTTATNHKGNYNSNNEISHLTELYPYSGNAWFQKEICIPESLRNHKAELFLERTRMTKIWINGNYLAAYNSLCTPHIYDISEYTRLEKMIITICVNNTDYPIKGGHMTSPDTQTNWNGITGEISLRFYDKNHIRHIKASVDLEKHQAVLHFLTGGNFNWIQLKGEWFDSNSKIADIPPRTLEVFHQDKTHASVVFQFDENAPLWDEYHPVLCKLSLHAADSQDDEIVSFGLTDFKANGTYFTNHGRKLFLRGKHDAMIFPLTGAAPTTVEEWLKVMQISKSYGINHYRFHTCCPPDAAFTAADLLGIFLEPELPFWGTVHAPEEEGFQPLEQNYLISEGKRILETFGNHPSFCMFSLGNELWGSPQRLGQIIAEYKKFEKRILFTQGSNNFQRFPSIQPEDDFIVTARTEDDALIRGSCASCDQPYGHVQNQRPSAIYNYDNAINYHKPVISHEIGQYASYPDFEEIPEYTGVLQARNLETFRNRLEAAGMADLAQDFFTCSGQLAVQCYKEELEAAFRSERLAGFQILDIQDFTGQGTASVGILNAFMESKKMISKKDWTGFCSDSVLLAEFCDYILTDKLSMKILLRHHAPFPVTAPVEYVVERGNTILSEGEFPVNIQGQGLFEVGSVELPLKPANHVHKMKVTLSLPHTENFYRLWQFPALPMPELESSESLCITSNKTEMLFMLRQGRNVLYFPERLRNAVKGFYCTDFWNYPMFRQISQDMGKELPVGTLGLNIHKHHQALGTFRCERWTTPQWYEIITHADCLILDGLKLQPIVQMIDNFERNHKLGILFECNVGKGKLLVCTSRLWEVADRPETAQFARSLISYASSEAFYPKETLTFQQIEEIL